MLTILAVRVPGQMGRSAFSTGPTGSGASRHPANGPADRVARARRPYRPLSGTAVRTCRLAVAARRRPVRGRLPTRRGRLTRRAEHPSPGSGGGRASRAGSAERRTRARRRQAELGPIPGFLHQVPGGGSGGRHITAMAVPHPAGPPRRPPHENTPAAGGAGSFFEWSFGGRGSWPRPALRAAHRGAGGRPPAARGRCRSGPPAVDEIRPDEIADRGGGTTEPQMPAIVSLVISLGVVPPATALPTTRPAARDGRTRSVRRARAQALLDAATGESLRQSPWRPAEWSADLAPPPGSCHQVPQGPWTSERTPPTGSPHRAR